MSQEKELKSVETEEERVYLLFSGGTIAAPSIDGPYSKERAAEILEFDKNQLGPAATGILTHEEAEKMLSENPEKYDNNSDIEIGDKE